MLKQTTIISVLMTATVAHGGIICDVSADRDEADPYEVVNWTIDIDFSSRLFDGDLALFAWFKICYDVRFSEYDVDVQTWVHNFGFETEGQFAGLVEMGGLYLGYSCAMVNTVGTTDPGTGIHYSIETSAASGGASLGLLWSQDISVHGVVYIAEYSDFSDEFFRVEEHEFNGWDRVEMPAPGVLSGLGFCVVATRHRRRAA